MIDEELERNIHFAREDARRRGLEFVTIEHLVLALLDNSQVRQILARGADARGLRLALESFIQNRVPKRKTPGETPPTEGFKRVIRRALSPRNGQRQNQNAAINGLHVLAAVYAERDSIASYYLQKHGVERLGIIAHLAHLAHPAPPADSADSADSADPSHAAIPPFPNPSSPSADAPSRPSPGAQPQTHPGLRPAPPNRPRDIELTAAAAAGGLESPFGRENEIAQAARALARKYKNNPLLVGEPGVGKTAVVHALAHRIASGKIPPALAGMKIFAVSVSDLVAGAKYRGDFEQRMRDLLEKCRAAGNAAIFIDEIHTVVGAGAASGGALDAANILKPALANGGIRCIGATTFSEFRRVFERDAALARRFQPINIDEPAADELEVILNGVVSRLEAHHGVSYAPDAAMEAAELSRKWMPNKFLPDKAIDILDDAGAHCGMNGAGQRERKKRRQRSGRRGGRRGGSKGGSKGEGGSGSGGVGKGGGAVDRAVGRNCITRRGAAPGKSGKAPGGAGAGPAGGDAAPGGRGFARASGLRRKTAGCWGVFIHRTHRSGKNRNRAPPGGNFGGAAFAL